MPPRSKVALLPEDVRKELERRIAERAFGGYEELAHWLQEQGYEIAEASVQRYGARMQQKLEEMEMAVHCAKAIAETGGDNGDTILDGAILQLQQKVFSALMEAEQIELDKLPRLVRTVSDLSRMTIARQKWALERSERLEQQKQAAEASQPDKREPRVYTPEDYVKVHAALLGRSPAAAVLDSARRSPGSARPVAASGGAAPAEARLIKASAGDASQTSYLHPHVGPASAAGSSQSDFGQIRLESDRFGSIEIGAHESPAADEGCRLE